METTTRATEGEKPALPNEREWPKSWVEVEARRLIDAREGDQHASGGEPFPVGGASNPIGSAPIKQPGWLNMGSLRQHLCDIEEAGREVGDICIILNGVLEFNYKGETYWVDSRDCLAAIRRIYLEQHPDEPLNQGEQRRNPDAP